jgi:hypothetical protein
LLLEPPPADDELLQQHNKSPLEVAKVEFLPAKITTKGPSTVVAAARPVVSVLRRNYVGSYYEKNQPTKDPFVVPAFKRTNSTYHNYSSSLLIGTYMYKTSYRPFTEYLYSFVRQTDGSNRDP